MDVAPLAAQLRATGVEVDEEIEDMEFGRFGWASIRRGNRFELWEPSVSHRGQAQA